MTDYTQGTDFSAKDALASGNALKKIKGADIDAELALIAAAIATKLTEGDLDTYLADVFVSDSTTITGHAGFDTAPTGTLDCDKANTIITLAAPSSITGTSNANTLALSSIPAAFRPNSDRRVASVVIDNGDTVPAMALISSTGGIQLLKYDGTEFDATGFTTSGTKGLPSGWSVTYPQ